MEHGLDGSIHAYIIGRHILLALWNPHLREGGGAQLGKARADTIKHGGQDRHPHISDVRVLFILCFPGVILVSNSKRNPLQNH